MSFGSIYFILFFIGVVVINYILPKKIRRIWLLIASIAFYLFSSVKGFLVLVSVILITYLVGLLLEKTKNILKKKIFLGVSAFLVVMVLVVLKYLKFIILNLDKLSVFRGLEIILPLGISFFILQSIGYLIDVYRGNVPAEKNIINYALFISFFPYIVSGPIERAKNMLPQIKMIHSFNYDNFVSGMQKMLWGYFLKLVVAERAAILANTIFNDYTNYSGLAMIIGILAYTIQLYCDFAGYSLIAIGVGKALGYDIMENFKQPYFALSINDFWKRWHISLTSWFREYLYIPLGGNRKGKFRKYLNIFIVFLISGIWHGANWTFMIWGMMHGIYQILGDLTKNLRTKFVNFIGMKKECFSYRLVQRMATFTFVSVAWVFFRSANFGQAIEVLYRAFAGFNIAESFGASNTSFYSWIPSGLFLTTNGENWFLKLGLDAPDLIIFLFGMFLVFIVDLLLYKKISPTKWINNQNIWFRWIVYLGLIFFVLTFGIYGTGFDASSFIYANF